MIMFCDQDYLAMDRRAIAGGRWINHPVMLSSVWAVVVNDMQMTASIRDKNQSWYTPNPRCDPGSHVCSSAACLLTAIKISGSGLSPDSREAKNWPFFSSALYGLWNMRKHSYPYELRKVKKGMYYFITLWSRNRLQQGSPDKECEEGREPQLYPAEILQPRSTPPFCSPGYTLLICMMVR